MTHALTQLRTIQILTTPTDVRNLLPHITTLRDTHHFYTPH